MAGATLITPTELYNILNQSFHYSNLSDPNYLLLFDTRLKEDYEESHVLTARRLKRKVNEKNDFVLPFDAELQAKEYVVVYDNAADSLEDKDVPAVHAAHFLSESGSRNPVRVLKGGYETFSALYPFLRTQKILYMPRELDELKAYPLEVVPSFLYIGTREQAAVAYIRKDLKIKAHVNCTLQEDPFYKEGDAELFCMPVADNVQANISSYFPNLCAFLEEKQANKIRVLVYSDLGISRCVVAVMAFLMQTRRWNLQEAMEHVTACCFRMCPNTAFLKQLQTLEC